MQSDTDFGGSIHHVVVGDDIAVGRDDDAAADTVLDLLALLPLGQLTAEEATEFRRQLLLFLIVRGFMLPPREVTATLTTAGVTWEATASIAVSSEVSAETLLLSSGAA